MNISVSSGYVESGSTQISSSNSRYYLVFVILGIIFAILSGTMGDNAELQVLHGNGKFTTNLYKILSRQEGNIFFSPISAHTCLSMAYQGAAGTTLKAFASSLQLPDVDVTAKGYQQIITRLNHIENITLLMANKIYLAEGFNLKENFKNAIVEQFQSEVQQIDFANNVKAAKSINTWVEEKTKNKIKDLITPDDLDSLTRLVLINAIYFKGNWANKFDPEMTRTEPFYLNDNDTVDVQMMHINKKFNYKHDDNLKAKILELPYSNPLVSMVVILPDEKDGIKDVEAKLENADLSKITEGTRNIEVELALPKFKIETTIPLESTLQEMGLGEIFDQNVADFSNTIDSKEQLYVSKVIQKAFIEVNEEGSEAAAATALIAVGYSMPQVTYFLTDHPFIILLRTDSNQNPTILFYGKVTKPKSGDNWNAPVGVPIIDYNLMRYAFSEQDD